MEQLRVPRAFAKPWADLGIKNSTISLTLHECLTKGYNVLLADPNVFEEKNSMFGFDPLTLAVLCLLLGCALIVLEVFIPSGGILSFFSVVAIVASLAMAFRRDSTTGLSFLVMTMIAVPSVVALAFKFWPMTPMGKSFLGELPTEAEMQTDDPRRELIGRVGIAKSTMLPSGSVTIDGRLIDAVSQGSAIEVGQAVVVVEVKGNRVVVRRADEQEAGLATVDPSEILSKPIDELGLESFDEPLG